ncbi:hypothetical protein CK228_24675 [Mesorhizobium sp. WSM4312]|uniref:hypothetical protein n=1 Tax=unclassified Mesorhizobium TaxID=325217 RepID=UPI000BAED177|nr:MULTISPECIES: hypothetical protein [unclassified Mesorhizobium]PBB65934.1 hypothetical protein CK228_24675 [Mesorhizobium sp. WSM4312]PBC20072.1 hypothetical protein CK226_25180 [Mesorhizobium sp. WSM4311]TRC71236.1 hypothetical protein FJV80_33675 [Mesorhizobium sp. WSM4310]TRC77908.1 hypothetical protein FJV81_09755 [Mesorhizobium sp. WSM4315]TRC78698.1 hypothetical protein FJV83_30145 [Mesorhizobium sp. WSM4307]
MDNVVPLRNVSARVEVAEVSGEWLVRVTENDQELTRSFDVEEYALSFAEGQRIRLGLDEVMRL